MAAAEGMNTLGAGGAMGATAGGVASAGGAAAGGGLRMPRTGCWPAGPGGDKRIFGAAGAAGFVAAAADIAFGSMVGSPVVWQMLLRTGRAMLAMAALSRVTTPRSASTACRNSGTWRAMGRKDSVCMSMRKGMSSDVPSSWWGPSCRAMPWQTPARPAPKSTRASSGLEHRACTMLITATRGPAMALSGLTSVSRSTAAVLGSRMSTTQSFLDMRFLRAQAACSTTCWSSVVRGAAPRWLGADRRHSTSAVCSVAMVALPSVKSSGAGAGDVVGALPGSPSPSTPPASPAGASSGSLSPVGGVGAGMSDTTKDKWRRSAAQATRFARRWAPSFSSLAVARSMKRLLATSPGVSARAFLDSSEDAATSLRNSRASVWRATGEPV
mmetsp:Transcript_31233/g.90788  ORF Transcript_31233/g.90788 Transcript_31233/m.90788 type:complete len:384 (+) Transcript_31233:363-1514(+)